VDTKQNIKQEIINAYKARENGNEGRARVCARRAAGWAIQIYLDKKGIDLNTPSALDHIKFLAAQNDTPSDIKETLKYFTQKVIKDSPDEEAYWPLPEIDLLEKAHWLAEKILGSKINLE
jgi:hypothetical protein